MFKNKNKIGFYEGFWIFFAGCFFGVVIETMYCLVKNGYIESRQGLIYGPFNFAYGFGALLITVILVRIKTKNLINVFCTSFVVGSLFEYLCSLFQQYVFGTVSWEYSHKFLNINGRITLLYSFFWGLLGILWLKIMYPKFQNYMSKISHKSLKVVTIVLLIFMAFNSCASFLAVYRREERYCGIKAKNSFDVFLDHVYPDSFVDSVYPNAMHTNGPSNIK